MTGTARVTATEAVRLYSEATGQWHRLVGRLAGGETGAVEIMPGCVVTEFTDPLVDDLFELHGRRLDLAVAPGNDAWATEILIALTSGGNGYCLHEPLRCIAVRPA
jgi:hypothetical protein